MTETSQNEANKAAEAATPDTAAAESNTLERLEALEAELANLRDERLRALAEVENVRRRGMKEKEDAGKFAIAGFARDLLTVADNLRRALEAIPAEVRGHDMVKTIVTGIEMTRKELDSAFSKNQVAEVQAIGHTFDPNLHQAMVEIDNSGKPAGTIVQVYQAGYILAGRLLRPALVGVAKQDAEGDKIDTSA
jgi:molecular chaperone GrpE